MAEDVKSLELRISKLEKLLEEAVGTRKATAELSPEEIKAFMKVRDVIAADFGDFCGINDCFRCIVLRCRTLCDVACRVCRACDVECSCGPCGGALSGRLGGRFSGLGE